MKKITVALATAGLAAGVVLAPTAPAAQATDTRKGIHTVRGGCSLPGPIVNGVRHSLHASYALVSWHWVTAGGPLYGGYIYASAVKEDIVQYASPVRRPARFRYVFYKFRAQNGDRNNTRSVFKYRTPSQWGGTGYSSALDITDDIYPRTVHLTAYWSTYKWDYNKNVWVSQGTHPICDSNTDGTRLTFAK